MAIVRVPSANQTLTEPDAIKARLAEIGIRYEVWQPSRPLPEDAPADAVLEAYKSEIDRLKESGGYVTADVIDVNPGTPGLPEMLARFRKEHWHDEDEVRFILTGRGVFHVHPEGGDVVSIETGPGDLIRVPRGVHHWFDLCTEHRIRAIRLFQDPSGWTPHYTDASTEKHYEPLCLGPSYIPPQIQPPQI